MTIVILSCLAIALYLAAMAQVGLALRKGKIVSTKRHFIDIRFGLYTGLLATLLHFVVLYQSMITAQGVNLGFTNAVSLVAWMIALLLLLSSMRMPLHNLAVVLLPCAALALGLQWLFPTQHMVPQTTPLGLQVHIVLSVLAFALLTLAALQALFFSIAERALHDHRSLRIIRVLPPLQVMEKGLFQLIRIGLFVLTLSLISGLLFLEDMLAQHLAHKTVLSILAWLLFGVLLLGRQRYGWRGQTASRWTLGGMSLLVLAYFGSKMVLEIVLERV